MMVKVGEEGDLGGHDEADSRFLSCVLLSDGNESGSDGFLVKLQNGERMGGKRGWRSSR